MTGRKRGSPLVDLVERTGPARVAEAAMTAAARKARASSANTNA
jgi:hypothetical protein